MIVTAFNGSRDCTSLIDIPSFFSTRKYDEFDSSNTPALIFLLISAQILLCMPRGIGRFLTVQGLCGIVGISISGKNSSLKCPHLSFFQAKLSWCNHIN